MKKLSVIISVIILFTGCVSNKLYRQSQASVAALQQDNTMLASRNSALQNNITSLENNIAALKNNINDLNNRISTLSNQNTRLGQLSAEQQSQLSESQRQLYTQQQRLQQLQAILQQQREQSENLKNKMLEALKGFNSNDLSIIQKNGKVYVSLSENLLFPSGSAVVNPKGVDALSRLAAVLNINNDVAVNIEGHTDSIPIRGRYQDNWDLSTARADAIVRILVNTYRVDPKRVIASGHSYFDPLDTNTTPEGRARNRRTEIILSPKLDEMYRLLEM
ncbi:MAG: flagellar motor protein MotB [Chitinophagaceae bacterium]|nr:flagellar motor protein MotB [Chitinophagaceae bacterium]MDB5222643.1 flagellar motor protein MotB [Chitinophagaceae bacterium]